MYIGTWEKEKKLLWKKSSHNFYSFQIQCPIQKKKKKIRAIQAPKKRQDNINETTRKKKVENRHKHMFKGEGKDLKLWKWIRKYKKWQRRFEKKQNRNSRTEKYKIGIMSLMNAYKSGVDTAEWSISEVEGKPEKIYRIKNNQTDRKYGNED